MSIEIETEYNDGVLPEEFRFDVTTAAENAVNAVLDLEECEYECCIDILLTGSEAVRQINRDTRGIDSTTDVLSFPYTRYPEIYDTDFHPDSGELMLGDVVLNTERIISQAEEYGHSVLREYSFLIVHSVLHLLGYDHMNEDDAAVMESKQRQVLDKIGIKR